jgi:hypothetical protein
VSRFASHEPEAFAGLQLEQSLDLELRLGGAGYCNSQVSDGLSFRRPSIEGRFDEHEACAPQNSVDQKKIVEPIRVNSRNPAPLHPVLPALGANCAREELEHKTFLPSSKFDSAPHYYGWLFQSGTGFATGARA